MITAQDVLEVLEKNLITIRDELGPGWPAFYHELASLLEDFANVTDRNELEVAVDPVWQVCRRYPFIKNLIHKRVAQRKLSSAGKDLPDEMPIHEIANGFQSLLDSLEEIEEKPGHQQCMERQISQARINDEHSQRR